MSEAISLREVQRWMKSKILPAERAGAIHWVVASLCKISECVCRGDELDLFLRQ